MLSYTTPKGRAVILTLLIILFFALTGKSHAQTTGTNTLDVGTSVTSTTATTIAPGAITVQSFGAPELADKTVRNEVRSVGAAIAPGVYNSSGQYTCFGGASAAVGAMGWGVGGGATVGQADCYRLHLMDKAQVRASAAAKAAAETKDPVVAEQFKDQANMYADVWNAGFCQFDDGQKMFRAAGIKCPGVVEQQSVSTDPQIRRREIGY